VTLQLMEASLRDLDPDVAEIMVRTFDPLYRIAIGTGGLDRIDDTRENGPADMYAFPPIDQGSAAPARVDCADCIGECDIARRV